MKKFLLLFAFCLLIIPKDTLAKSIQVAPSSALFQRSTGESTTITNFEYSTLNGRYFYYFKSSLSTPVNRIIWYYNSNQFSSVDRRNTYDVVFAVYSNNIEVANDNGLNGSHPFVTFSGMNCDVDFLQSGYGTSVTYSQMFQVTCRNVELSNNPEVSVISPGTSGSSSSLDLGGNAYYGVSSGFSYVVHNGNNDDVVGAIKDQTEETKKQTDEIKKGTEATKEQTETIKDSDTSDASDSANSFFSDFESDDFGLSDIVTMPLEFIKGLSSNTCNSLKLPMPFINQNVELPCMTSIYQTYFGSFLTLYQAISTGLISYWVCINIFALVQGFKNPENDQVEVLDL